MASERTDRRSFLKATGTGVVLLTTGSTAALADERDLQAAAKEHVAAETGAAVADLAVVNEAAASWSTLGERYYNAKVQNTETRSLHGALLDADGTPVDRAVLDRREERAYREQHGRLGPRLHETVEAAGPGDEVEVVVWLDGIDHDAARDAVGLDDRPNDAETKRALATEHQQRIDARTSAFVETVTGRFDGVEVISTGHGSTTVELRAPAAVVERVQHLDGVWRVFERETEGFLELDSATRTHGTNDGGYIEHDCSGYPTGHVEFNHPYDSASVTWGGKKWSDSPSGHPTVTTEAIASNDSSLPGTAYDADVYSADDILSKFDDRMSWLDSNGVCSISTSFGIGDADRVIESWDFKFGQEVYNSYLNITNSAGNNDAEVTTPSLGFNVVSVGAIDDQNTNSFGDDAMAGFSSHLDPYTRNSSSSYWPHEKPETSAVGVDVATPHDTGGSSGTSMASPLVSGLITVLCKLSDDYGTIDFSYYPEVAKPILAASATHDDFASEEDVGYGVPYEENLEPIVSNGWFESDLFYESNDTQTYSFDVSDGETVRVALFWLSNVTDGDFSNNKDAQSDLDLDLSVTDPNGNSHSSWAYDTSLEFVEFTAQGSGQVDVEVHKWRWDASESSRWMGLAWYRV
jgi:hypothetical protein